MKTYSPARASRVSAKVLSPVLRTSQDVVIAGAVLFMFFSCARASDAARAVSLFVDFTHEPDAVPVASAMRMRKARPRQFVSELLPWV